ncbi:MAG: hypothetical protein H0V22_10715 [Solirubrobacterales bacterium]|nr:hypothetical protein [Solirubrobacterales bacterium]
MGWTVPFVSWEGSDFNFDIAWTEEEVAAGRTQHAHQLGPP